MTDQELDRMLRGLLLDSLETANGTDGTEPENVWEPSERFHRSMDDMLRDPKRWARHRARPVWKRLACRAAAVLLVCTLALGGLTLVSPTVRAEVNHWIEFWRGDTLTYRYMGDGLEGELPVYELTGLPKGYIEDAEESVRWETMVSLYYRNEVDPEGDVILFDYLYMQDGAASFITLDEGDTVEEVTVNGLEGKLYLPEDAENWSMIEWIDPQANLHFSISALGGREELLRLAESVKETGG